ncbi:MAG: L-seryl-tRNA(Sec) selenium transferase [Rhodoblastus sp.]
MSAPGDVDRRRLPSVDETLRDSVCIAAIEKFGRATVTSAVRAELAEARSGRDAPGDAGQIAARAARRIERAAAPSLRPVFNLTGTVLHTNLGRARLAQVAIAAATHAMREAVALEFDVGGGKRGERDDHLRGLVCELTGAQDATIVNNNAAAVLLVLNTLARGKRAIVSRGELIEIGGAFRMPDIMARAGAKLVEIGTTNRTHAKDYVAALEQGAGLVLKVHTSNYRIEGFTKEVSARDLAALARAKNTPLVNDLGSGVLVDLTRYGLKREPTVAEAVADGADLVTFSGDKLLGGPQAGFIVGRKDLIARINKNPMKRALRIDKIRIAAIEATLKLYRNPDRLALELPTLKSLARSFADIEAQAARIAPFVQKAIGAQFAVEIARCASEVGSGASPVETVPSAGIAIRAKAARGGQRALIALNNSLRGLPWPVIGRIADGALVLDLRCLTDEDGFVANLAYLPKPESAA